MTNVSGYLTQFGRKYRLTKDGTAFAVMTAYKTKDLGYVRNSNYGRIITSELDIFALCDLLGVKMSPEQAAAERAYIERNLKQYQNRKTMTTKKEFGLDANGYPVYAGETIYRKSSGEKFSVNDDGSVVTAQGVAFASVKFTNYVHTFQATDKAIRLKEAGKAAAKQREHERKDTATVDDDLPMAPAPQDIVPWESIVHITDQELADELRRRGYEVTATKQVIL